MGVSFRGRRKRKSRRRRKDHRGRRWAQKISNFSNLQGELILKIWFAFRRGKINTTVAAGWMEGGWKGVNLVNETLKRAMSHSLRARNFLKIFFAYCIEPISLPKKILTKKHSQVAIEFILRLGLAIHPSPPSPCLVITIYP